MSNTVAPVPVDQTLTAIAVAYKNEKMIADEVLPRVRVDKQNFKYRVWEKGDNFTIPNTVVGRTSQTNQVEFGFTEKDSSAKSYGIEEPVPNVDLENAPEGHNILARAAASMTDLIELDREKRTADLVFNANSYAAASKTALTGKGQFSDPESDPIKSILGYMDKCIMRPNVMVIGQAVWTILRQHPKIAKATHGNAGDSGVASRMAVAELFEIDKLLVGSGWHNVAKKGQEGSLTRLWGNHIALLYQDAMADTRGRVTFGFTAQFGDRVATQIADPNIGLNGGVKVRVGEYVRELITAGDLGFLIQNAVA